MSKLLRIVGCAWLVGAILTVSAGAAQSAPGMAPIANLRVGAPGNAGQSLSGQTLEYSTNWSGYSATSSTMGAFTSVTASWTQPALSCTSQTSLVAFWTGLDGNGSNTVEQTGILGECVNGVASYLPWYEMYPGPLNYLGGTVNALDNMTSTVTANGLGGFTLVLNDATQKWTDTEVATLPSATQESAEVIAEAPSSGNQVLPLANFGTVSFTGATVNGAPIGDSSNLDQIDMVSNTGQLEASASGLTTGGNAFSIVDVEPIATPPPHGHVHGHGH